MKVLKAPFILYLYYNDCFSVFIVLLKFKMSSGKDTNFNGARNSGAKRSCILTIRVFVIIVAFLSLQDSSAQGYGNWWYFGDQCGIDFNGTSPTAVTGGSLVTQEGCSSISDAAGNLLMYTDGSTVYASTHTVMSNGTGLLGHNSTAQSAVIVKQPGNTNIFYIFTMGVSNLGSLHYSVVDMSLASGHGSVTVKNTYLYGPCLEKLTAVKHSNNSDVWILVHENSSSTNFQAYLLTATGINTTAVVSNVGASGTTQSIGYLRASPDGQHIASAFYGSSAAIELYSFNRSNGTLSNPIQLSATAAVYGCEFSPDGTKLYGSSQNNIIHQWQICAGSASAIAASLYTMSASSNWAMQLAPDGKIYVSRYMTNTLGVVHNPNAAGSACNYVDQSFTVTGTCRLGLPNYVTSWFAPPPPNFTVTVGTQSNVIGCMTASYTSPSTASLTLPGCSSLTSSLTGVKWDFGDPLSGSNNTSTAANPVHHFSGLGTFTTSMVLYYSGGVPNDTLIQTVQITQPCITVNSTSITCASLGSATVTANGGVGPFSYTWMPGSQTGSVATGLIPGSYTISVYDQGTTQTYTSQVIFTSLVPLAGTFSNQQDLLCYGATNGTASVTNLTGGSPNQTYLWTNGSSTLSGSSVNSLGAGVWTVTVTDGLTSCQVSNVFLVVQPQQLAINIAQSTPTTCVGSNITFTALASGGTPYQNGSYTYTWLPGNVGNIHVVSHSLAGPRIYTVSVLDSNSCAATKTTAVTYVAKPFIAVTGSSICPLQTGTLTVTGASSYTWSSGGNSSLITDSPASTTIYTVTGQTAGCTNTASGSIFLKPVPVPVLSSNSPRCANTTLNLFAGGGISYYWTGPPSFTSAVQNPVITNVALANGGVFSVTVTAANSCTSSGSATVVVNPIPSLSATGSTVCTIQNASLTSLSSATSFTWLGPLGFNSTQQNPTWPAGQTGMTGVYSVVAQSGSGCTVSAVAQVSVMAPPSLSLVGVNFTFCANGYNGSAASITLTAGGATTYTLETPPEVGTSNANGPSIPLFALSPYPVIPTVHSLTLTGSNGICSTSSTYTVKVVPNPTVILNETAPEICIGQNFDYQVSGASSYSWMSSVPQFTYYGNGKSATAGPPLSTQFQVTGAHDGCYSQTETTQLTVHPLPVIDPVPANAEVCIGNSVKLGVKGTATSYTWTPPSHLSSINSATTLANPAADLIYTIIGSVNNCTASTQVSVAVLPLPQPTAWISRPAVCVNDTFTLRGSGGDSYWWKGPDGTEKGGKDVTLSATLSRSGQFTLTVTDDAGCSNSAATSLLVHNLPLGTLDGKLSGCIPFCTELSFNSFLNPQVEATWQVGSRTYSSKTFTTCFPAVGTQTISGTLKDKTTGCFNTTNILVNALPLPSADFSWLPEKPVAGYEPVQLTEKSSGEELTFTWYFLEDQAITEGSSAEHSYGNEGRYPVALVVQDKEGCSDSVVKYIDVDPDFVFFMPNSFTPNGDEINDLLYPVTGGLKSYYFAVYARWGEKIFESSEPGYGWNGTFRSKNCKQDVYVWTVDLTNHEGISRTYKGTVMLVR